MCVLIFLSFVLLNLTLELDPHKEMMRRTSLTLGIFGISFSWRSMDSNLKSIYCIGLNRALLRCRIINCWETKTLNLSSRLCLVCIQAIYFKICNDIARVHAISLGTQFKIPRELFFKILKFELINLSKISGGANRPKRSPRYRPKPYCS